MKMMQSTNETLKDIVFEEIAEEDFFADYTGGCSGNRSACCTRVCTRDKYVASEEEWGKFLAVEGGIIQY